MSYKVHFVGLVCFYKEPGARLALLPDGLTPPQGIDAHYPSILVAPDVIADSQGWPDDSDTQQGIFYLPPCTISIEGMDTPGDLDVSGHDDALPQLRQIDPAFQIDPQSASTSARLNIRQGTLTAHSIPKGDALVSQLVVPHEGAFTITVTPTGPSPARTLRLQAGAEVIVGNMAAGGVYERAVPPEDPQYSHFRIYEKLSVNVVTLPAPSSLSALSAPDTNHWFFVDQRGISLDTACTNTGCC